MNTYIYKYIGYQCRFRWNISRAHTRYQDSYYMSPSASQCFSKNANLATSHYQGRAKRQQKRRLRLQKNPLPAGRIAGTGQTWPLKLGNVSTAGDAKARQHQGSPKMTQYENAATVQSVLNIRAIGL